MEISPISLRKGYVFGQITELGNRKKLLSVENKNS